MSDKNEIIEVQAETPLAMDTLLSIAEQAEKRIDAMNKIKRVALKLTNASDWVDQGGKPYLQVSGAEKIGRMFGVSWRIGEAEFEALDGGHFSYAYRGSFTVAGASIEAIGTRSSKDGFFKRYAYENGAKTELPASEIDRGDVKKAAYTNCIGNGITRLLGVRNLTYADLQEFAGITKEQVMAVDYKKGGKAGGRSIASEGAQEVSTAVEDVRIQTKKKDGTAMKSPLYTVKAGGVEYKTFSETFAQTAKEAKEAARPVVIRYVEGKYGNDIERVAFADDGPGKEE